jgi:diaminopimelate epimerase
MDMRFSKYQGIGNDFVMLADPDDRLELEPEMVRAICDRRFGIGGDGVIRVAPGGDGAEFFMDYVNSDGSVAEMCGNGIRCLALFARAEGLTSSREMKIGTRAGLKVVEVLDSDRVRVDMGAPIFEPERIPVVWDGSDALDARLDVNGDTFAVSCVSMGNPHAILLVDDPEVAPVTTLGPKLEVHEAFPNKTNVEFMRVEPPDRIRMRVWERGSGETLACGTAAAATAVVGRLLGGAGETVTVSLPGGELEVSWDGSVSSPRPVYMTGPAVEAFSGEFDLDAYKMKGDA